MGTCIEEVGDQRLLTSKQATNNHPLAAPHSLIYCEVLPSTTPPPLPRLQFFHFEKKKSILRKFGDGHGILGRWAYNTPIF
jgi:hypothetical protein